MTPFPAHLTYECTQHAGSSHCISVVVFVLLLVSLNRIVLIDGRSSGLAGGPRGRRPHRPALRLRLVGEVAQLYLDAALEGASLEVGLAGRVLRLVFACGGMHKRHTLFCLWDRRAHA